MKKFHACRTLSIAALTAAAAALAACGGREAESETPVAEAEVETELPESVVSDEQLEATADVAADMASQPPPPAVVAVPVPGNAAEGQTQEPVANEAQPAQ